MNVSRHWRRRSSMRRQASPTLKPSRLGSELHSSVVTVGWNVWPLWWWRIGRQTTHTAVARISVMSRWLLSCRMGWVWTLRIGLWRGSRCRLFLGGVSFVRAYPFSPRESFQSLFVSSQRSKARISRQPRAPHCGSSIFCPFGKPCCFRSTFILKKNRTSWSIESSDKTQRNG